MITGPELGSALNGAKKQTKNPPEPKYNCLQLCFVVPRLWDQQVGAGRVAGGDSRCMSEHQGDSDMAGGGACGC